MKDTWEKPLEYKCFRKAEIGEGHRCGQPPIKAYDFDLVIKCLKDDGMSDDEAHEWMEYNILGNWVGDQTPIIIVRSTKNESTSEVRKQEDSSGRSKIQGGP